MSAIIARVVWFSLYIYRIYLFCSVLLPSFTCFHCYAKAVFSSGYPFVYALLMESLQVCARLQQLLR